MVDRAGAGAGARGVAEGIIDGWLGPPKGQASAQRKRAVHALARFEERASVLLGRAIVAALARRCLERAADHVPSLGGVAPADLARQIAALADPDVRPAAQALLVELIKTFDWVAGDALVDAVAAGPGERPTRTRGGASRDPPSADLVLGLARDMARRLAGAASPDPVMPDLFQDLGGHLPLVALGRVDADGQATLWHEPAAGAADLEALERRLREAVSVLTHDAVPTPARARRITVPGAVPAGGATRRGSRRRADVALPLVTAGGAIAGALSVTLARPPTAAELALVATVADLVALAAPSGPVPAGDAGFAGPDLDRALAAVVSHDVRNALGAIQVSASVLRKRLAATTVDGVRPLDTIQRATGRINQVLQNLVDALTLQRGHIDLDASPRELAELIEEAVGEVAPLAAPGEVRIEVALDADLPCAFVDGPRLVQALINVLTVATRRAAGGATLRVCASREADGIAVRVIDAGPAFGDHELDAILTIAHWVQRGSGVSGGIGLAVARSLLEAHRGRLTVTVREGRVNEFRLLVPVAAREAAPRGGLP